MYWPFSTTTPSQSKIFSVIVACCYCRQQATITENISLWEGVVVLKGQYIWAERASYNNREYFTLGGYCDFESSYCLTLTCVCLPSLVPVFKQNIWSLRRCSTHCCSEHSFRSSHCCLLHRFLGHSWSKSSYWNRTSDMECRLGHNTLPKTSDSVDCFNTFHTNCRGSMWGPGWKDPPNK